MRIGITGHQNVPAEALPFVVEGIARVLDRVRTTITGVTSLAMGADQLFAQAVVERHGRLHVIVPCADYERTLEGPAFERFQELLAHADAVERLPYPEPSEEAYLAGGQRVVEHSEMLVAVWDGLPARGKGGTADIVAYAREKRVPTEIVWPAGVPR